MPPKPLTDLQNRTNDSLLDLVIETAPDAIVTADTDGTILSFSPAAERIFGFTEDEMVGTNVRRLMPEPHRSAHDDYMNRYLETGVRHIIGIGREVRAERKGGEVFVAELAIGELVLGNRRIFTGFIRDVSDRVEAEARVRDLQRTLEKVARVQMLGEMSTALSHEINQPLTAITNFARAAQRALGSAAPELEKIKAQVDAIAEQALRAGEIMKRMRMLVDRGQAQIQLDDINDIIREAVNAGRATSDHIGPEIRLDLAEGLPPVLADRIQIQQVIVNLLNNALEAVQGTGAEPVQIASAQHGDDERGHVHLRAGSNHAEVVVTVSDSGPGVDERILDKVFDPLVTTKPSGVGVGLSVCRTIVQAHGGEIWVENPPGGGAAFRFTLPAGAP